MDIDDTMSFQQKQLRAQCSGQIIQNMGEFYSVKHETLANVRIRFLCRY
jgi:hypothetical protein